MTGYMSDKTSNMRALLCFGILRPLFDEPADRLPAILEAITAAFKDLEQRYGMQDLGSFDDDQIMMGPSAQWPWTAYILAEVPDYEAVIAVCSIVRQATIWQFRMARYIRVEASIGFGTGSQTSRIALVTITVLTLLALLVAHVAGDLSRADAPR